MEYERYALYYAPPQRSLLADFGNAWLGWDPENREEVERLELGEMSVREIAAITQTPSRYGFHGTLKPPFRLKEGRTADQLDRAVANLAERLSFIMCGPLELKMLGRFLALVPTNCHRALSRFAGRCVEELDEFRAPADETELQRRRTVGLSTHQEDLLLKWGYPYVMDEFRFHLTLTEKLSMDQAKSVQRVLKHASHKVSLSAFEITEICLFGDPGKGEPFHLLKRYSL